MQVWPDREGRLSPGTIQENRVYIFELARSPDPDSVELYVDDVRLEALRSRGGTARWSWSPGFYAGGVSLRVEFPARRHVPIDLETDPDLRKLTRQDFDRMVAEILEDTLALLSLSGFRIGIARGTGGRPPPIARLELLRSRVAEIETVIRRINARPVRILRSQARWLPIHRAKRFTGEDLMRSLARPPLRRTADPQVRSRLPEELNGYLPEEIRRQVRSAGLNIREHEEIRATLKAWAGLLERYAVLLGARQPSEADEGQTVAIWGRRCRALSHRLSQLLALPLFREISDRPARPMISSIYRRIPAYRRFFQLYQDMNLGIANVFGDFLNVPLARTFELYELWCFLRLLRVLVRRHGDIVVEELFSDYDPGSGSLTLPAGAINIPLPGDGVIAFQRTYVEYWKDPLDRGSFSRPMRPDLSLEFSGNPVTVLVLDAKYRIEQQLNEAITSIHTYRDAIVAAREEQETRRIVRAAYLLAPFVPGDLDGDDWKPVSMPGRLFHRHYRGRFRFGAATMKPGMSLEAIGQVFDQVLEDSGLLI